MLIGDKEIGNHTQDTLRLLDLDLLFCQLVIGDADADLGGGGGNEQRDLRHLQSFARVKNSRHFLVCKTDCADGESKGTSRDPGKRKVPFLVRRDFPLLHVPFALESHPGGEDKVPVLVHHRPADGAQRFTGVLAGHALRSGNRHRWCVGQGSVDALDLLRPGQKRKAAEQETERTPARSARSTERQPAPLESVARES